MAPAQQRLAAGDPVVLQAEAGLVVDFKRLVGDRLAQIDFQQPARRDLRVHVRLEEAIGAPAGRFGGIHRQIRVLQDLVQVGAVLRRQRDADAGVGGDLMAEAFIGRADRLENPGGEVGDLRVVLDGGLHHGEFVAAEPRHEVVAPGAAAQAHWRPISAIHRRSDGRACR